MNSRQVIVVGAGISGLACALGLREFGVAVRMLDAAENPGGLISTVQREGFLFESGPQSFQLTSELRELIRAAGCESELLEADPRTPRYILRGGKLRPAPMSPPSLLTTSLLSAGSKMRVLSEPFRRSEPAAGDESLADFVRRKFGTEILDHLAGPFVSGVFAGDPEKLSLRSAFPSLAQWEEEYGSVIRGAMKSRGRGERVRPTLASFKNGMATLLKAMAQKLGHALAANVTVRSIQSVGPDGWTLHCSGSAQPDTLSASAIVFAVPAYAAAKLLASAAERLATTLSAIPYAPVAVVAQGYRREHVGHMLNGFGFLVPRTEKLRTLGTIWNSSLFPGRCPPGTVLMTSFLGGATDPQILGMDDIQIANQVHQDIAGVLRISAPPIAQHVWRHVHALPQYNLGHAQKVATVRDDLSTLQGLFIAGNYLDGPSIGSCVLQGFRTAQSVRDYLSR
ncbi:MAG: protoporphyrinogen oxidase [Candidatus Acidiferrales bacterium]